MSRSSYGSRYPGLLRGNFLTQGSSKPFFYGRRMIEKRIYIMIGIERFAINILVITLLAWATSRVAQGYKGLALVGAYVPCGRRASSGFLR
jgi:hypothetical protein